MSKTVSPYADVKGFGYLWFLVTKRWPTGPAGSQTLGSLADYVFVQWFYDGVVKSIIYNIIICRELRHYQDGIDRARIIGDEKTAWRINDEMIDRIYL